MVRKQYTPMTDEQARWLRAWAGDGARVLHRVMKGLSVLGHDVGSPVCRRTYDAEVALRSLARDLEAHQLAGGIWTAGPWRGDPPGPPPLSPDQRDYLRGVAVESLRSLRTVAEYFDRSGCPSRGVSRAVRDAVNQLHALTVHLHYLDCPNHTGGTPEPELPTDPAIDCGAGI